MPVQRPPGRARLGPPGRHPRRPPAVATRHLHLLAPCPRRRVRKINSSLQVHERPSRGGNRAGRPSPAPRGRGVAGRDGVQTRRKYGPGAYWVAGGLEPFIRNGFTPPRTPAWWSAVRSCSCKSVIPTPVSGRGLDSEHGVSFSVPASVICWTECPRLQHLSGFPSTDVQGEGRRGQSSGTRSRETRRGPCFKVPGPPRPCWVHGPGGTVPLGGGPLTG